MCLCAGVMWVMTARRSLKIKLCKTFVRQKSAQFSTNATASAHRHARTHVKTIGHAGRKFESKKNMEAQGLGLSKILAR
jgi:hypothetical protein